MTVICSHAPAHRSATAPTASINVGTNEDDRCGGDEVTQSDTRRSQRVVALVLATQYLSRCPLRVTSGGSGPTLRRQVDLRQRTPPAARVASGSGLVSRVTPVQTAHASTMGPGVTLARFQDLGAVCHCQRGRRSLVQGCGPWERPRGLPCCYRWRRWLAAPG
jgi:hypothetical protein